MSNDRDLKQKFASDAGQSAVLQHRTYDPSWRMSAPDSHRPTKPGSKIREDGWTRERQLRFLDTLSRTRSVTRAAAAAGMSRESAYRLRERREGALFSAIWDLAIKVHNPGSSLAPRCIEGTSVSRRNPRKVTKWKKCTTPGFRSLLDQLRDLTAREQSPSAPSDLTAPPPADAPGLVPVGRA